MAIDYTDLGLSSNLCATDSLINKNNFVSAYDFDANFDQNVISTTKLSYGKMAGKKSIVIADESNNRILIGYLNGGF